MGNHSAADVAQCAGARFSFEIKLQLLFQSDATMISVQISSSVTVRPD